MLSRLLGCAVSAPCKNGLALYDIAGGVKLKSMLGGGKPGLCVLRNVEQRHVVLGQARSFVAGHDGIMASPGQIVVPVVVRLDAETLVI